MKVAVFIKKNELTTLQEEKAQVVVFNIEEDKVVGVENISLEEQNRKSIENWLKHKSINKIYLSEIDDHTHQKLNSHGIKVKTIESLKDDKLFKKLAIAIS